jgi:hypothetical protein
MWLQPVSSNDVFMPFADWLNVTMKSLGPMNVLLTPAEGDGRGDIAFVRGVYLLTINGANARTGNDIEIWQKKH